MDHSSLLQQQRKVSVAKQQRIFYFRGWDQGKGTPCRHCGVPFASEAGMAKHPCMDPELRNKQGGRFGQRKQCLDLLGKLSRETLERMVRDMLSDVPDGDADGEDGALPPDRLLQLWHRDRQMQNDGRISPAKMREAMPGAFSEADARGQRQRPRIESPRGEGTSRGTAERWEAGTPPPVLSPQRSPPPPPPNASSTSGRRLRFSQAGKKGKA